MLSSGDCGSVSSCGSLRNVTFEEDNGDDNHEEILSTSCSDPSSLRAGDTADSLVHSPSVNAINDCRYVARLFAPFLAIIIMLCIALIIVTVLFSLNVIDCDPTTIKCLLIVSSVILPTVTVISALLLSSACLKYKREEFSHYEEKLDNIAKCRDDEISNLMDRSEKFLQTIDEHVELEVKLSKENYELCKENYRLKSELADLKESNLKLMEQSRRANFLLGSKYGEALEEKDFKTSQ